MEAKCLYLLHPKKAPGNLRIGATILTSAITINGSYIRNPCPDSSLESTTYNRPKQEFIAPQFTAIASRRVLNGPATRVMPSWA